MDTVIAAAGLTKQYRDVVAVDRLTLNIKRGEIYGFLGLNGAGKTTTIRMLLGMVRPNAGDVALFGTPVKRGIASIWQRVGYMVETPHAYPDLTVRENLEMVRRLRRLADERLAGDIIGKLGLTHYADRRARNLSLGNAQRLGLAKAMMHHPDLLILDEPANALDPAGIVEIRNLLSSLANDSGVTIFVSSHILGEVARLATRIGVIHEGRLVKEIAAEELAKQEEQRLVVEAHDAAAAKSALEKAGIAANAGGRNTLIITDEETMNHPEGVATILVTAGCPPSKITIERGDLESYFLTLVGMGEE